MGNREWEKLENNPLSYSLFPIPSCHLIGNDTLYPCPEQNIDGQYQCKRDTEIADHHR